MFGLSTELITKGKLATAKRFEQRLFKVANLPLISYQHDPQAVTVFK